jgi:hypothetical protein
LITDKLVGRARPRRRYAILIAFTLALALAVAASAWPSFNALISLITLD